MTGDVRRWLEALDLAKYKDIFAENEIEFRDLSELTEGDLKEMGLPIGPRRRVLKATANLAAQNYVSVAVASSESTSQMQDSPAAERRQLTVMFCDLADSTALSAQLDPEDLREVLTTYQTACTKVIEGYGGFVAKFMGDGVLAYFGYPRAHEDDAEQAVRAGLALVEMVGKQITPAGEPLAARVGVATGLVIVGDLIGEGSAQEQAVVGETPNLAARLQGLARTGQVVIAETTRRLLGETFDLTDLGPQNVKGIDAPVSAFAVDVERSPGDRFEAQSGPALLPMVGRDQELALLLERWEHAKVGEGQAVLLIAEAGVGKSRIIRALFDALADEPHTRIRYQCSPYHTESALWPVIQQLTRGAGLESDDSTDVRLDKLEKMLAKSDIEAGAAPLIARLVGVDGESKYGPINLTPQAQRTRTLDKLAHQLPGLAARQPVLVVLEDAHWIDPTTLELMEQCLDCIVGARVLILFTSRPENQPRFAVHRHFTQLTLNRLGRTGIEAIIKRLSRGKTLPREVVGAIAARTDGVPLFAEELTKTILESGVLHEAAEGYELTVPLPELAIPATLHDSLMARLDRLASVKELAQTAAVIGREFTHEMIAAITQQSQSELEEGLELLIKGEIIFRRGARALVTYSFNHALVQNAAYQSLLKSRRQQLHAQFARALEERFSETVRNEPELLAHHYSAAGITERAVLYWEKAGERAVQRSANVEAIDHLRKGLELLGTLPDTPERARQELPLQTTLGSALMAVKGQGAPETGQSYERARQLGEQVGDAEQHFRAVWGSWRYHFARSDHVQAAGLGEQCLNLAEQAQDVAFMLESRFALGASLVYQGKFVAARDSLERAISLYDIEKHHSLGYLYGQDPGASNLSYMSWVLWFLGHPDRASEKDEEALVLAETLGHPLTLALVLSYLAMSQTLRRDWSAVRQRAGEAMAVAREQGFPQVLWLGAIMNGRTLMESGQLEDGIAQIEEGVAARKAMGVNIALLFELALLAEARGMAGQIEAGLDALTEAHEFATSSAEGFYLPEIHRLRGELLLRQDEHNATTDAERCFRLGLDIARHQRAKSLELRTASSLARLWRDQGKTADARVLLKPVYGWFTSGFDTTDLLEARALLDEL